MKPIKSISPCRSDEETEENSAEAKPNYRTTAPTVEKKQNPKKRKDQRKQKKQRNQLRKESSDTNGLQSEARHIQSTVEEKRTSCGSGT